MSDGTREHEHSIELPVPIDRIWKAISEGEELTRWYVESAEVSPGTGGTVKVSFGQGMDGQARIETWEPGRRLRLAHLPPDEDQPLPPGSPDISKLAAPIVEEFIIETREGRTFLRLINSGIPDSEDWDGYYEGTRHGWDLFLLQLRHYLEHHFGAPRRAVTIMRPMTPEAPEAYAALLGPGGLTAQGALPERGAFAITTALGERLTGQVLVRREPRILVLDVEEWNRALLSIALEQMGPMSFLYLSASLFGDAAEQARELERRWGAWLAELLPAPTPPDKEAPSS